MDEVDIYLETNFFLPLGYSYDGKKHTLDTVVEERFPKPSGKYSHELYFSQYSDKKINYSQFRAMQAVADYTDESFLDENPMLLSYREEIPKMIDLISANKELYFPNKTQIPTIFRSYYFNKLREFYLQNKVAYKAHELAEISIGSNSRISSPFLYHGGVLSHFLGNLFVSNILGQKYIHHVDNSIAVAALFWNDISMTKSKKTLIDGSTTGACFLGLTLIAPKKYLKYLPRHLRGLAFSLGLSYEASHQYFK